jgi:hypothetical protein
MTLRQPVSFTLGQPLLPLAAFGLVSVTKNYLEQFIKVLMAAG